MVLNIQQQQQYSTLIKDHSERNPCSHTTCYCVCVPPAVVGGLAPPPAEDEARREIEAQQQVMFVLESAQLEVAQVGKV